MVKGKPTNARTHTRVRAHTYMRKRTHACTNPETNTHTQTHTHTQTLNQIKKRPGMDYILKEEKGQWWERTFDV